MTAPRTGVIVGISRDASSTAAQEIAHGLRQHFPGVEFAVVPSADSIAFDLPAPSSSDPGELERFRGHSMELNAIGFRIAQALGKIGDSQDIYYGNATDDLDELLQRYEGRMVSRNSQARTVLAQLASLITGAMALAVNWANASTFTERDDLVRRLAADLEHMDSRIVRLSEVLA